MIEGWGGGGPKEWKEATASTLYQYTLLPSPSSAASQSQRVMHDPAPIVDLPKSHARTVSSSNDIYAAWDFFPL